MSLSCSGWGFWGPQPQKAGDQMWPSLGAQPQKVVDLTCVSAVRSGSCLGLIRPSGSDR